MSKKVSSPSQLLKKRSTRAKKRKSGIISGSSPFEILCASPEQINPALLLAEELMRKGIADVLDFDDLQKAEETLAFSRDEIKRVETQFNYLVKTPPAPSLIIPVGF